MATSEFRHITPLFYLWIFAKKEMRFIIGDPKTIFFIFAIPIIEIFLAVNCLIIDVKNVEVAVLDLDQSQTTHHITEEIDASPFFYIQKTLHSTSEMEDVLKTNQARLVIVFNRGFDRNLLRPGQADMQLIPDMSDPNIGIVFTNYAQNIIYESLQQDNSQSVNIHKTMLYNPALENAFYFIPGITGMVFTLICSLMTSFSITREKERGTLKMLLLSPINRLLILLGKTLPYFVLSLVNMFIIILISVSIYHLPIPAHPLALLLFACLFIFSLILSGLLISFIASNQIEATLMSGTFMVIPLTMLSGTIFPIENMPRFLQYLSDVIPARWFTIGYKKIVIQGLNLSYVTTETLAMSVLCVVLSITIIWFCRKQLE